jgi:hypothetical protein
MGDRGSALEMAEGLVGRVAALRRHPAVGRFPELEVGLSAVQMEYAELVVMLREGEGEREKGKGEREKGEGLGGRFRDGRCAAANDAVE